MTSDRTIILVFVLIFPISVVLGYGIHWYMSPETMNVSITPGPVQCEPVGETRCADGYVETCNSEHLWAHMGHCVPNAEYDFSCYYYECDPEAGDGIQEDQALPEGLGIHITAP